MRLSIFFPFVDSASTINSKILLQVDDYYSYKILSHVNTLMQAFPDNLNMRIHYKIFKNIPLDSQGRTDPSNPDSGRGEVHIDNDYYFVLKNKTFQKDNDLFLESVFQLCLFNVSPKVYFTYVNQVLSFCFTSVEVEGTKRPVSSFASCADQFHDRFSKFTFALDKKVGFH